MGAANIVQKHITKNVDKIWTSNIMSKIPSVGIQTSGFNKSFVSFTMFVGAVALLHGTRVITKKCLDILKKPKTLTKEGHQQKYGKHSYAVVCEVKNNDQWVEYLAKNGYNLILMGRKEDIVQAKAIVEGIDRNLSVVEYQIDWMFQCTKIKVYQNLQVDLIQKYDISILVLPKYEFSEGQHSSTMQLPAFEAPFMLARIFANPMGWRSYKSAIVVLSEPNADDQTVEKGKGVMKGCKSALDAFGRVLNFEFKQNALVQVIVARGSPENAFALIGLQSVSN